MEDALFVDPLVLEILDKYEDVWAIWHLASLGGWDMETYMPDGGIEARSKALARADVIVQRFFLEKGFAGLVRKAQDERGLNDYEKGVVRMLARSLDLYEKLPADFLEELSNVTTQAIPVWREAKRLEDFTLFKPYLGKIIELEKKKAEYIGYNEHPYDALLDDFDEGLTLKYTENYFEAVRPKLREILDYVLNSPSYQKGGQYENLRSGVDKEKMKVLTRQVLELLGFDQKKVRLDESAHPFTSPISDSDVRITTRYDEASIIDALGHAVHEYGHALCDLQGNPSLKYTPIHSISSFVINESQSLFWENLVLKDVGFMHQLRPLLVQAGKSDSYDESFLNKGFNQVQPGLIRIQADELTYPLHIMVRFEIEKGLIEGKISVEDLPKIWNQKYKEYLGVEPKNNSEGVLQDIHWAHGGFGYFPTYLIAKSVSSMYKHCIEKDLGDFSGLTSSAEGIKKIQQWLGNKVHRYGSTYKSMDLVRKSLGEELSPSYFLNYMDNKYKSLYQE